MGQIKKLATVCSKPLLIKDDAKLNLMSVKILTALLTFIAIFDGHAQTKAPVTVPKKKSATPSTLKKEVKSAPDGNLEKQNAAEQAPRVPMAYYFLKPKPKWRDRTSYELELALGRPGNKSLSGWSYHFALSGHFYYSDQFDVSIFYKRLSAKGVQNITFDTTYSEERVYSVKSNLLGLGARRRIQGRHFIEARTGVSFSSSTLTEISTDAPTLPTLEVGYKKPVPWGIPLDLQYSYEFRTPRIAGIVTAAYTLSALGKNETLAQISLGLGVKFFTVPWEKRVLEPADDMKNLF